MTISTKYGRTYHFPFSPGTTSDDRINHNYWDDVAALTEVVCTEKLDGENNCLSKHGVFARSHVAPTTSPWTRQIRERWEFLKRDLGDLEVFGENLYAVHSIEYQKLEHHYYVFGIRHFDKWLSWEETKFYAASLDLPTVPELKILKAPLVQAEFEKAVLDFVAQPSVFESIDTITGKPCSMEGVVCRSKGEYAIAEFKHNVFKYVRKGHVKTDDHWTRNWKRAKLMWEKGGSGYVDHQ